MSPSRPVALAIACLSLLGLSRSLAYTPKYTPKSLLSRRRAFGVGTAGFVGSLSPLFPSPPAVAADDDKLIDVYFGCGCFWHVQHEFAVGEIQILKRKETELTARAGAYRDGGGGLYNNKRK